MILKQNVDTDNVFHLKKYFKKSKYFRKVFKSLKKIFFTSLSGLLANTNVFDPMSGYNRTSLLFI